MAKRKTQPAGAEIAAPSAPSHQPFVPDEAALPEFTWPAVAMGALLGIVFGASSLYLVLKVGMTVSASIPVAVLSITLFRGLARAFGLRRATILENNIVQTTGSAGESIAFGVGVTIPALMLLGFDMSGVRVMTVGTLGGLLGILMMIPLRRAFIVKQHDTLPYPEGTACAEVLIVGEKGGTSAKTVFAGFGIALVYKFCIAPLKLWKEDVTQPLYNVSGGLKQGVIGGSLTPELLGVGYIIGPRIGAVMLSGAILASLVLTPLVAMFGQHLTEPLAPSKDLLIGQMNVSQIRQFYILYVAAGAVAAGGILSMFQALPLIYSSLRGALGDFAAMKGTVRSTRGDVPRTERDLPLSLVVFGSLALVLAMAAAPSLGLGFEPRGIIGSVMIVLFGFLFVTVSSRLTGQIGSSSNPISGMTVATLLLTCLVFVLLGHTDHWSALTALTIAAVVCIAASNGGTTSQDLKTGYLVGATPRWQQIAIVVGAVTSALVMGGTLLLLNEAGTVYTKDEKNLPQKYQRPDVSQLTEREYAGGQYAGRDPTLYHVWHVGLGEEEKAPHGKYLVDDQGQICYLVDPAINGRVTKRDDGQDVANKFDAPKTQLMALIIGGIFQGQLPWELVLMGVLIAVALELIGVPSLPFAVGFYLPIETSVPIFIGGSVRWLIDRFVRAANAERKTGDSSAADETSPGVLMSSGYIAGGSIAGVVVAFLEFAPEWFTHYLPLDSYMSAEWNASNWPALFAFAVLVAILGAVASGKLFGSSHAGR